MVAKLKKKQINNIKHLKKIHKYFFKTYLKKNKENKTKKKTLKLKNRKILKEAKTFIKKTKSIRKKKLKKILNTIKKKIQYSIYIKITPNNIFCILKNHLKNQTVILLSAGILKLKITKKKLKFVNKLLIKIFIKKIKDKLRQKTCLFKISGPKKIRKFVSKQIILSLNKSRLLIDPLNKKVFNGCRAKKIRRKKRKGLRIFK